MKLKIANPAVKATLDSSAARLLIEIAQAQGLPFGHEYSTKLAAGSMAQDRHLLTLPQEAFGNSPYLLLDILTRKLELPPGWNSRIECDWVKCTHVHLGVEASSTAQVWKVYFESAPTCANSAVRQGWCRIHTGYKWTAGDPESMVISQYDALLEPGLLPRLTFIDQVLTSHAHLRHAFNEMLNRLHGLAGDPMLLRVSDENSSRLSVDVNLYPAELTIGRMKPLLRQLAECCGLSAASFEPWLERFAELEIGHLAAGVGANGQAFVTIYCGMAEWNG